MKRFAVVGTTGVGKSTLAERIARKRNIPFVDLDAYFWGPNWTELPRTVFHERVANALTEAEWVTSGNYKHARQIVWARADTLVWLDYSIAVILWRLLKRSVRRIWTQEELWNGNSESWRDQFWSRDSLLLYALQTHEARRREIPQALATPEYAHLQVFHFKHSRETEAWLKTI